MKNQKGTELVEFAIISLLLFLLLFGIIDFGILLYDKNEFVCFFDIKNVDGSPAPLDQKFIYLKPTCNYEESTGAPGGENYGVLAKQPRLVDWSNPYSKF